MRPWKHSSCISCLLLIWLAGPTDAAPRKTAFDQHYQRAVDRYQAGSFAESIEAFEAAYRIRKQPRLLVNIARAHYNLQHPEQALRFFALYQQLSPPMDPADRARLEIFITDARSLRDQMQQRPVPLSRGRRIAAGVLGGLALGGLTAAVTLTVFNGQYAGACRFSAVDYASCEYALTPHLALSYSLSGALAGAMLLTLMLPSRGQKETR